MKRETQQKTFLTVKGLTVSYGETPVVKDLELGVAPGEIAGLVGESGSGKTSVGLALMGLCKGHAAGRAFFKEENLLDIPRERLRTLRGDRIAMVFQDTGGLHPAYSARNQVAENPLAHREISKKTAKERAGQWLAALGLPETKIDAFPHQLSGGERQRVIIAIATINRPDLLILDEPVSFQDEHAKSEIIHWLQREFKSTGILLITHDVSVALRMASRLWILCGGRIVEEGETDRIIRHPVHPYTRALLRSNVSLNPHRELIRIPGDPTETNHRGCPFQPRCAQAVQACRLSVPALQETRGRRVACHRGGVVPFLSAHSVSKAFTLKGKKIQALRDVTFSIHSGEGVALMGPTGSGKSTLATVLSGLAKPDTGRVVSDFNDSLFRRRVQMTHQNPKEAISPRFTVWETIDEPLKILKEPKPYEDRITKVLKEVGLPATDAFLNRTAHSLSGGELKRLILARALVLDPLVVVADEPTAGVDASFASQILRLLMTLQETRGVSLLIITHDPFVAQKVADRILYLKEGKIEKITSSLLPVTHQHPAVLIESQA